MLYICRYDFNFVAFGTAERDENICREQMTVAEILAIGAAVEALERPAAKERQKEHGRTAPGKKNTCGNLPQVFAGKTRDRVAAAVGVSGRTYEKAKQVANAAEKQPEKFGDLPSVMEAKSVDAAHKVVGRVGPLSDGESDTLNPCADAP